MLRTHGESKEELEFSLSTLKTQVCPQRTCPITPARTWGRRWWPQAPFHSHRGLCALSSVHGCPPSARASSGLGLSDGVSPSSRRDLRWDEGDGHRGTKVGRGKGTGHRRVCGAGRRAGQWTGQSRRPLSFCRQEGGTCPALAEGNDTAEEPQPDACFPAGRRL